MSLRVFQMLCRGSKVLSGSLEFPEVSDEVLEKGHKRWVSRSVSRYVQGFNGPFEWVLRISVEV